MTDDQAQVLAERVRAACVSAAKDGYEQAGMSGLCAEGALEMAISAMERLDIQALIAQADRSTGDSCQRPGADVK